MNLGDVKAQFVALMNRTDLKNSATLQTTFINQAVIRIQRELRAPFMERTVVTTISATYTSLPVPNDLLELIGIYVGPNQEYELQRSEKTKVNYLAAYGDGQPLKFARLGTNWILGPKPKAGDVVLVNYYAVFPALVSPTDTNVLTQTAWDLLLYAALSAACDYFVDDRKGGYENQYQNILTSLQDMADADELTADAAVSPVNEWPCDY